MAYSISRLADGSPMGWRMWQSGGDIVKMIERVLGATRLEPWLDAQVQYFAEDVLLMEGVREVFPGDDCVPCDEVPGSGVYIITENYREISGPLHRELASIQVANGQDPYEDRDTVAYVGETKRGLRSRVESHKSKKGIKVSRLFYIAVPKDRRVGLESALIALMKPYYNRKGMDESANDFIGTLREYCPRLLESKGPQHRSAMRKEVLLGREPARGWYSNPVLEDYLRRARSAAVYSGELYADYKDGDNWHSRAACICEAAEEFDVDKSDVAAALSIIGHEKQKAAKERQEIKARREWDRQRTSPPSDWDGRLDRAALYGTDEDGLSSKDMAAIAYAMNRDV